MEFICFSSPQNLLKPTLITLYFLLSTLYFLLCTFYFVPCTLYLVPCTLYFLLLFRFLFQRDGVVRGGLLPFELGVHRGDMLIADVEGKGAAVGCILSI